MISVPVCHSTLVLIFPPQIKDSQSQIICPRLEGGTQKGRHILEPERRWLEVESQLQPPAEVPRVLPPARVHANNLKMEKEEDRGLMVFYGNLDLQFQQIKQNGPRMKSNTHQPHRTECPETTPLPHSQLFSISETKSHDGERTVPLINSTKKTGYTHSHLEV